MLRNHFRLLSSLIRFLDLAFLLVALYLAAILAPMLGQLLGQEALPSWLLEAPSMQTLIGQSGIVVCLWLLFAWRGALYDSHRTESRFALILQVGQVLVLSVGFGALLVLLASGSLAFHPLLALVIASLLLTGSRVLLQSALYVARSQGFNFRRVLVVGRGPGANAFLDELHRKSYYGLRVIGALSFRGEEGRTDAELETSGGVGRGRLMDLGVASDFQAVLTQEDVDQVLIFPSGDAMDQEVADICRDCDQVGVRYLYTPGYLAENRVAASPVWYGSVPSLEFRAGHRPSAGLATKRIIDILGAGLGLLLLSPVLLTLAAIIWFTDRGPIFFKQVRVGKGGRRFACYKFRSMQCNAEETKELLLARNEADGPVFKIRRDPRVTTLGKSLRKVSPDELPQLWNVLRGDMSIVGPRPPVPEEVRHYEWWQRRRLAVKPGLTCIWQVWGRNQVSFKRWVEMDLQYIDGWSLWLDIKLICHTFGVVFRGTGM